MRKKTIIFYIFFYFILFQANAQKVFVYDFNLRNPDINDKAARWLEKYVERFPEDERGLSELIR